MAEMGHPLEINLHKILQERVPKKYFRFIPGFLIGKLERVIRQKELNEMLRVAYPARGHEFATAILRHLGITVTVEGEENIPQGRIMFASNHPLGGLDGIALISVLGQRYGDSGIRFLVNDMLMHVEPLRDVFLPVNKYGSQGREAARDIKEALASDKQILQFPAGLVSRLHDDGEIKDLEWQKSFVTKAIEYDRAIVPVRFEGLNSMKFYKMARRRKKLGLKVNIEQVMLPGEVCKAAGSHYVIKFGEAIPVERLREQPGSAKEVAARIRDIVLGMKR